jgi:hypothetical protein
MKKLNTTEAQYNKWFQDSTFGKSLTLLSWEGGRVDPEAVSPTNITYHLQAAGQTNFTNIEKAMIEGSFPICFSH